jgi:ribosomal protein S27E
LRDKLWQVKVTIEYITTREIENKSGQVTGKVRIIKVAEESDAMIEITCPECGNSEKRKETWAEPLVTGEGSKAKFAVKCNKCGFVVKMLKLKKEVGRKKK